MRSSRSINRSRDPIQLRLVNGWGTRPLGWLAFTPLVVLALLIATLRTGSRPESATLREDILSAVVILGVVVALATESLGAFHAITFGSVLIFWLVVTMFTATALVWCWRQTGPPAPLRLPDLGAVDALLVASIAAIALVLLVVAWLAPPQSPDSIGYHMSRVMHWIQNRSLDHYPTPDAPQLYLAPFAEIVRLHLQMLSGADRAGCLLQWLAAMGALCGVSLLARDLGGGRRAQIFAALFTITLPIGITQASSGKNGWVEALWLVSFAHFSGVFSAGAHDARSSRYTVTAFAALGLGLMTRITASLFALPLVLLAALRALRNPPPGRQLLTAAAAGVAIVGALCGPYFARNLEVYGHPLADPDFQKHGSLEQVTPALVLSNVVRHAAFQFGTPSKELNDLLMRSVVRVHDLIGADPFDRRSSSPAPFQIRRPTRIEELAFNPLHLLLVLVAALAMIASRRVRRRSSRLLPLLAVGGAYLLFCSMVKWQAPGGRLLMPLFVLAAPLVAVVVEDLFRGRSTLAISAILFITCVPYAVATSARPLSFEPGKGLLVTPRSDLYFARVTPAMRNAYKEVAQVVKESHVRNLGVVFPRSGYAEYLLWLLLKDVEPPVRIENVAVKDQSGRLASLAPFNEFHPDLVVVFATGAAPNFRPEIVAAGRTLALVRSAAPVAFYEPRER